MKTLIVIVVALVCLAVGFFAGRSLQRGPGMSNIQLDNQSGQDATQVEVIGRSGPLPSAQTRNIPHAVQGEGGFDVRVTFADGHVAEAGNVYIESGSTQSITVGSDRALTLK